MEATISEVCLYIRLYSQIQKVESERMEKDASNSNPNTYKDEGF
jgi:hypothetical protein